MDPVEKIRGGIAEDDLGLVLDSDQVVEASLLHEGALVDDAHPVTHFLDLLQKMGAEEDGESTILQLEDEITDLTGADRVDPGSWFVEDKETGVLNECLGQSDTLEHSLGVATKSPLAGILESDQFEKFEGSLPKGRSLHSTELTVEPNGFLPAEVLVEVGVLREEAHLLTGVNLG